MRKVRGKCAEVRGSARECAGVCARACFGTRKCAESARKCAEVRGSVCAQVRGKCAEVRGSARCCLALMTACSTENKQSDMSTELLGTLHILFLGQITSFYTFSVFLFSFLTFNRKSGSGLCFEVSFAFLQLLAASKVFCGLEPKSNQVAVARPIW